MNRASVFFFGAFLFAGRGLSRAADGGPVAPTVTIQVDRTAPGIRRNRSFAGFSYEKGYLALGTFDSANAAQVALFKRLGPGILRIGANQTDETAWASTGKGRSFPLVAPSDIDRLAGFLHACDWRVVYAVRFVNNTPEKAAEEAAYVAQALGDRLVAFEIGNEPDHYAYLAQEAARRRFIGAVTTRDGRFRDKGFGAKEFFMEWTRFRDAIACAVPHVAFVGPSCGGGGVDKSGKDQGWAKTFAEMGGRDLCWLTTHYYIGGPQDPEVATLGYMLNPQEPRLIDVLTHMKAWTRASGVSGGFHLDEANSYYGGGKAGLSDTHAAALWVINFLFTCAQNDACEGVSLHSRGHVPYTPIAFKLADSAMADDVAKTPGMATAIEEIRPEYYGLLLFDWAIEGRLLRTKIAAGPAVLSAYAVAADDGSTRVVLVNTSDTTAFTTNVSFAAPTTTAILTLLTGPSLTATDSTSIDGAAIGIDGTWDRKPEESMRTPDGRLTLSLPPHSAILVTAR